MTAVILVRVVFLVAALGAWYWTQSLIGKRAVQAGKITDRFHELTAAWQKNLQEKPKIADRLLIVSSLLIDGLGLFIMGYSIVGPSVHPLIGLLLIFSLRQICQATTALPVPDGMIWRDPGFPSLLVTYGVSNDLFFSGHTAIAVLGAILLHGFGNPWLTMLGLGIAVFEVIVVIVLRAHYTLDVFTGLIVALWLWTASQPLAGWMDRTFALILK